MFIDILVRAGFWPQTIFHSKENTIHMRYIFRIISTCLLMLICLSASTCAAEISNLELNFEILSSDNLQSRAAPVYGDVSQGEVDIHTYYVASGSTSLDISLTWDISHGNGLRLIIHPPSGTPISFNDDVDGSTNGKIILTTPLPSSMTGQYWRFDVVGVSVNGVQSYTLKINC